jgi:GxxExxY protein
MSKEGKEKIIYKELSYKLVGLCFEVHDAIGRFGKEKQYCDALEELLKKNSIRYKRELDFSMMLGEQKIGGCKVDFLVEEKILFDAKAKNHITKEDYRQMKRYLSISGLKLCVVVNFREISIKPRRILNPYGKK